MALAGLITAGPLAAEAFVPTDESQVLERLPRGGGDPALGDLKRLAADLARDPDDLELALDLARRYLELGRADGDPRYQGYAQAALAPWWDSADPPPGVLLLRAMVRQSRHDFDGALADLERLLRLEPRNSQAWLTRAVILQVKGDLDAAEKSCLPVRRASRLLASACFAGTASLGGRAEASYAMLERSLESAPAAPGERVWALTTLAEIAERLGRHADAERHYQEALSIDGSDVYLLGAYADLLLDLERPAEVRELLADKGRSDALLLRLALAEARLGGPGLRGYVETLGARFAEAQLRGDRLHLGAEARFRLHLVNEPSAALELAAENWTLQREPIDAQIVLESAIAKGDAEAARPVLDWLESSGLEDVKLAALARELEEVTR